MSATLNSTPHFGKMIRAARKAKGWSQEYLANRLGVSQSNVHKQETRQYPPFQSEKLPVICNLLSLELPTKNFPKATSGRSDGNQESSLTDGLSLSGLSDLQKACLKRAHALMAKGHLTDAFCLNLLVEWKNLSEEVAQ